MAGRLVAAALKKLQSMASEAPIHGGSGGVRFLSSSVRRGRKTVDIGARARELQNRRLWGYGLSFSCVAGFVVIVLNNFQDQLVFYVTPSEAMEKFASNPSKNRFRLGGLVVEGSVAHPSPSSPEMEFVITDLVTDMLVRYEGSLPDLFREGHSAVVEGFLKRFEDKKEEEIGGIGVVSRASTASSKAREGACFFQATEVLAKHDEKYMPKEVAAALDRNKKMLEAEAAAKIDSAD
ncbi:transmembrane protein G1P-related 1 [Wolffia australiana]